MDGKWASDYDKCISCGKSNLPHKLYGLCTRCYSLRRIIKNSPITNRTVEGSTILIEEYPYLYKEFIINGRDISDIAKENGRSRKDVKNRLINLNLWPREDIEKKRLKELDERMVTNSNKTNNRKWAFAYDCCIACGRNEFPHASKGLCKRCYEKYLNRKYNPHLMLPYKIKSTQITAEHIKNEYLTKGKSIVDIARENNCTRQYIFKLLKKLDIPFRGKSEARFLAYERKKVIYKRKAKDGSEKDVFPIKQEVDDYFFSYWSAPMAWILGFIYADGSLDSGLTIEGNKRSGVRVSMSQKEPEILEKIKFHMRGNQKLIHSERREYNKTTAGECYHLIIYSKQIFHDLIKIGLTPNKSLSITFPDIPNKYLWHFIRGLWDGDGSLYIDKKSGKLYGSFVSGSKAFINKFLSILDQEIGIGDAVVHKRGNSYQFRLSTPNTLKLCHHLYDGVTTDMILKRKHNIYLKYLEQQTL